MKEGHRLGYQRKSPRPFGPEGVTVEEGTSSGEQDLDSVSVDRENDPRWRQVFSVSTHETGRLVPRVRPGLRRRENDEKPKEVTPWFW